MKNRYFTLVLALVVLSLTSLGLAAETLGPIIVTENTNTKTGEVGSPTGMQIISVDLYPGEEVKTSVRVRNVLGVSATLETSVIGRIAEFIDIENPHIDLESGEEVYLNLSIHVPMDAMSGIYSGSISLQLDDIKSDIPANIRVLLPQRGLLQIKIEPLMESIHPGEGLPVQITIKNPQRIKQNVNLSLQLLKSGTGEILSEVKNTYYITETTGVRRYLQISQDVEDGRYGVRGVIQYLGIDGRIEEIEDIRYVNVKKPLLSTTFFGIPIWFILGIFFILMGMCLAFIIHRRREAERKRYLGMVDYRRLPRHGKRSAFIGRIAESGVRAFLELDRLTEHVLIAGSTGGGKTVAAQDIAEEALKRNVSVLVFDPTAQWTGFLRPNKEKGMFRLYPKFGMKKKEAQRFNGRIKIVKRPWELDITEYMKPGEITIFCMNHLNPEDIEDVIIQVILDVFKSRMEEATQLKTLIVFDEVHRLLPKFGGTGKGLIQLERGVREFRKWGIGLVLISQVLTDYPKDIKANVGTEIQMRTRYEGDLSQIKMKYGEDIMKSVVKARVGTGMIQNSQYNRGNPYFVTFRPLLHNPRRLSDKELDLYEKYDLKIESFRSKVDRAKARGIDVFDLELELDLAAENLRKGSFQVVDMYIEGLKGEIEKLKTKEPIRGEIQKPGNWEDEWERLREEISK